MSNLTPTMQKKLDEVTAEYNSTGKPVAVSAKNRTAQGLVTREAVTVVDEDPGYLYLRPVSHDGGVGLLRRTYNKVRGNKHRSKAKGRR